MTGNSQQLERLGIILSKMAQVGTKKAKIILNDELSVKHLAASTVIKINFSTC